MAGLAGRAGVALDNRSYGQRIGFAAGILGFFGVLLFFPEAADLDPRARRVLAVLALMAAWWISEAVPVAITSLLPLLLFPLLGVMSSDATAKEYTNDLVFLFFGGFFLALALERWNLHRRLALRVLAAFGTRPAYLVLGVMVAVALISMWISNTATALMMLPICGALADETAEKGGDERAHRRFTLALLLGTAYAASIGGIGTPIGTSTNGVFMRVMADRDPPSFLEWMAFGVPIALVYVLLAWFILVKVIYRLRGSGSEQLRRSIRRRIDELGPMTREERSVLGIFILTVCLWVFRSDIGPVRGWVSWLSSLGLPWLRNGAEKGAGDSIAAILAVVLLCTLRVRKGGATLADWESSRDLPWGMLLLFGGGFALAQGFRVGEEDGRSLSVWIASSFESLADLPPLGLVFGTTAAISFLSEITSNTATAAVTLPILARFGDPEESGLLCLAATLAASNGFMLPVATPPNAIVFASGRVPIFEMIRAGFLIDLIGIFVVTLGVHFIARPVLG